MRLRCGRCLRNSNFFGFRLASALPVVSEWLAGTFGPLRYSQPTHNVHPVPTLGDSSANPLETGKSQDPARTRFGFSGWAGSKNSRLGQSGSADSPCLALCASGSRRCLSVSEIMPQRQSRWATRPVRGKKTKWAAASLVAYQSNHYIPHLAFGSVFNLETIDFVHHFLCPSGLFDQRIGPQQHILFQRHR